MYFFISRSAVTGLEGISDYVVLVTPDNSSPISINVDPKILIPDLENQIQNTKNNFLFQSMIATGIIILLSSICTWFVTRRALTPLRRFSDRIRQVQAQNLSEPLEVPLSEDEISRLTDPLMTCLHAWTMPSLHRNGLWQVQHMSFAHP